jgi:zinc transport system substrate-binding protein
VEKIGGPLVDVYVMVRPGQNPHTYEPTPKQMSSLADTDIYFSIGVTFEDIWLDKIASSNPGLRIVSTYEGIKRRTIEKHSHEGEGSGDSHNSPSESLDPHIWLDPNLVIHQAKIIADALIRFSPANKLALEKNLNLFVQEMTDLDKNIRKELKGIKSKAFLVFHPTWGYFTDEYGLEQIAIEKEGKEPSARHLAEIIELAKKKNIKIIFVQAQFSRTYAESIATAIGARVISVDPLSADYTNNLLKIAKIMAENLK